MNMRDTCLLKTQYVVEGELSLKPDGHVEMRLHTPK